MSGNLDAVGLEENLRFTSYGYDPVIGKHFAGARFYGGSLGRMMGEDPVKRGLNGYSYCNNDPVNYTDPTGEIPSILIGDGAGALGSAAEQLIGTGSVSAKESIKSVGNAFLRRRTC